MTVRVLIADDSELIRSAIEDFIRREVGGGVVCGSFADGKTVVEMAVELKPDIVVLDFQMPLRNGINAGCAIRALLPTVPLILYTFFASPSLEAQAKEAGFSAVVQKGNTAALIAALRSAHR